MSETSESFVVVGRKSADLCKALRKFSNEKVLLVAKTLYTSGALSFGELREKTGLSTNTLNHTITEMRNADLVIRDEGIYYLTKYCAILLGAINHIKEEVCSVSEDNLFLPVEEDVDDEDEAVIPN